MVEKGTGVLNFESENYNECVGEVLYEIASITYDYHMVTTPNGEYVYHDLWLNLSSTLIGESGTVWTLKKNVSPFVDRSTGGGATHFTARTTYVSDTGQTLELRSVFHISFDANGELKVERGEFRCWLKD